MVAYFAAMNFNTGYKSVNILLDHAFSGLDGDFFADSNGGGREIYMHTCIHAHTPTWWLFSHTVCDLIQ